jgi:hypothetical protein
VHVQVATAFEGVTVGISDGARVGLSVGAAVVGFSLGNAVNGGDVAVHSCHVDAGVLHLGQWYSFFWLQVAYRLHTPPSSCE